MILAHALSQSDLPLQMAARQTRRGEVVARKKVCGTRARGYTREFRIVAGYTDPTTVRRLTKEEDRASDWKPLMKRRQEGS